MLRFFPLLLSLLFFSQCSYNAYLSEIQYDNDFPLETAAPSQQYELAIEPYRLELDKVMNEPIGKLAQDLSKAKPESTLGNLLADATLVMSNIYATNRVDISVLNYGGIRLPQINKGDLTLGTVYELMPFDNYLVLIDIDGETLQEFCNAIAAKGGWPISGMKFKMEHNIAADITVNGIAIEGGKMYKMAISDYVANGGDNMEMLVSLKQENTNVLLRDAFIEYFKLQTKKGKLIDATINGRITNE